MAQVTEPIELPQRGSRAETPPDPPTPSGEVSGQQTEDEKKKVRTGFFHLYRYATGWNRLILILSTFCAIVAGVVLPLVTVCIKLFSCVVSI